MQIEYHKRKTTCSYLYYSAQNAAIVSAMILNVVLCLPATKPFMSVHNYTCLVHTASHFKENAVVSSSLNVYSDS